MGCGGARIPKSLFLVRGCRGPAPRPCAQRATLLGRGSASLRSRPSRPGTRVLPPLGARPRPGSPARIRGPSRPRVRRAPADGEPARVLPGGLHKSGSRGERGGASRHGGFIASTLGSQKTSRPLRVAEPSRRRWAPGRGASLRFSCKRGRRRVTFPASLPPLPTLLQMGVGAPGENERSEIGTHARGPPH